MYFKHELSLAQLQPREKPKHSEKTQEFGPSKARSPQYTDGALARVSALAGDAE